MVRSTAWMDVVVWIFLVSAQPVLAYEVPFTGLIVDDQVTVRSGAGTAYYEVGKLQRGTVVRVEEVIWGWQKIVCPEGVYSYISKAFVDAKGDGQIGFVNSDGVEVKAGDVRGPGHSLRVQVVLNKADKVQIITDEEGKRSSFYKIVPPKDAFVFLPPGSARSATTDGLSGLHPQAAKEDVGQNQPLLPSALMEQHGPLAVLLEMEEKDLSQPDPPDVFIVENPTSTPTDFPQQKSNLEPSAIKSIRDETVETLIKAEPVLDSGQVIQVVPGPSEQTVAEGQIGVGLDPVAEASSGQQAVGIGKTPVASGVETAPTISVSPQVARSAHGPRYELVSDATPELWPEPRFVFQGTSLRELDREALPLFKEPLEHQPIESMVAAYNALLTDPSLTHRGRQEVDLRLAMLHRNQEIFDTLQRIAEAKRPVVQTATGTDPLSARQPSMRYSSVGKLLASSVYDGKRLPRLYRLAEPVSGRTIAYVEPSAVAEPWNMLGQLVGVRGDHHYDSTLRLNVFLVERIDLLNAGP